MDVDASFEDDGFGATFCGSLSLELFPTRWIEFICNEYSRDVQLIWQLVVLIHCQPNTTFTEACFFQSNMENSIHRLVFSTSFNAKLS